MSDAVPEDVLEQIQKIFRLAEKNPNENEAASALAKGQELLERYNLTYEAVSSANVGSGAREKTAVEGGYWDYERDLWRAVAQLNFCLWWFRRVRNVDRIKNDKGHRSKWLCYHSIVGRKVNVAATKAMASYLLQAANQLTYDQVRGWNDTYKFDNYANSYRRGVIERLCRKLRERRKASVAAEEERLANQRRSADGASTSRAVSLMVYIDKETDANLDFVYGEGYSAREAAAKAEAAAEARRRQEAYTKWAAAHPEEAAERAALAAKALRHRSGGRSSGRANRRIDVGAYWSGYDAADNLSIDQQVDRSTSAGRLTSG